MTRTASADSAAMAMPERRRVPPARPANASVGSAVQRPTPGTAPMKPATTPAMTSAASQTAHQSSDVTRELQGVDLVCFMSSGCGAPIMTERCSRDNRGVQRMIPRYGNPDHGGARGGGDVGGRDGRTAPRTASQETLDAAGLIAPVEIVTDRWGISHIYAENEHDLFFAQGYAAARDRLFQFEIWRRRATGTVAEMLGPREFERDTGARLFRFRGDLDDRDAALPRAGRHHHPGVRRRHQRLDRADRTRAGPAAPSSSSCSASEPEHWTPRGGHFPPPGTRVERDPGARQRAGGGGARRRRGQASSTTTSAIPI